MSDLLSCPFCGGEAEIFCPPTIMGDDDRDVDYVRPHCAVCGVSGLKVRFNGNHDFVGARAEAVLKATTAWNTRTTKDITTSVANWGAVALLTSLPGSSVTVTHAGVDYALQPCASVICHGIWAGPNGRTFTGKDHLEALSEATLAFSEATRGRC